MLSVDRAGAAGRDRIIRQRQLLSTAEGLAAGWRTIGKLAVSPRIESVDLLPLLHFEEYYVYDREPVVEPHRAFVNRVGFSPLDEDAPDTRAFWEQVERYRPEHVVGAGTPVLFLVTRDEAVWRTAIESVVAYGSPEAWHDSELDSASDSASDSDSDAP